MHENIDRGIEYFPKKYLIFMFSAKTTSHEFRFNITLVYN